ncbi:MAG: hypothetical protein ACOY9I_09665 [Pseudomonadota bacterium]
MNELDKNSQTDATPTPQTEQVDAARRRLTRGGAAGAGVLLSVASRSAFGTSTWGTCTGSEIASGNLSREGTPRPCGCSPGFWGNRNGKELWAEPKVFPMIYGKGQSFNSVFGVEYYKSSESSAYVTLENAIDGEGMLGKWAGDDGNMRTVAFHAVAALLNAYFYGSRYPAIGLQTPEAVIIAFQNAFNSYPRKSRLLAFKDRVDVYDTADIWCNGDRS